MPGSWHQKNNYSTNGSTGGSDFPFSFMYPSMILSLRDEKRQKVPSNTRCIVLPNQVRNLLMRCAPRFVLFRQSFCDWIVVYCGVPHPFKKLNIGLAKSIDQVSNHSKKPIKHEIPPFLLKKPGAIIPYKYKNVDRGGIEPPFLQCECSVLPLYERPLKLTVILILQED